jgi:hypothetical protein
MNYKPGGRGNFMKKNFLSQEEYEDLPRRHRVEKDEQTRDHSFLDSEIIYKCKNGFYSTQTCPKKFNNKRKYNNNFDVQK